MEPVFPASGGFLPAAGDPPDLDASPGWQQWLMTVLILVPGLLMQLPFFQRVMIFTSGWKTAQGPYRQVLEQALEP